MLAACADLERRIIGTPAFTSEGLSAKLKIIDETDFATGADDFGLVALVETILEMDAERIDPAA